jgi:4-amino-4-deoxy-L-arabinose transferase-like glycosyltransferase
MPQRTTKPGRQRDAGGQSSNRQLIGVLCTGLAIYVLLFYAARMPSLAAPAANAAPRRIVVLTRSVLLLDEVVGAWFGKPPEFSIADRLPIVVFATATLFVAGAAGWLLIALIGAGRGLDRMERTVFSLGVGLSAVSLYVLAVGLCGGLHSRAAFFVPAGIVFVIFMPLWTRGRRSKDDDTASVAKHRDDGGLSPHWLWLAAPFAVVILLGAMLPPVDFDVREYHLQAPKEFFQQGRVTFMPHNVYGNFPLGAELLGIPAMAITGDWWLGSLVGKTLIGSFAPLTALALFCAGRRFYGTTCGVVAAVVYLATPWVAEVSAKGLIEGTSAFYLLLALYGVLLWRQAPADDAALSRGRLLLAGFLAGSAVACKYPAVLFVLLPLGAWVLTVGRFRAFALYSVAAVVACGPWLAKNAAFTGNPVYPLLYGLFDGATRTAEKNAQWVRHHSPPNFDPADLAAHLVDVVERSEWLSPVLWPLAALSLLIWWRRRGDERAQVIRWLWLYLAFIVAAWWLATHRIDRFWVPALPIVALLAGAGAIWSAHPAWRKSLIAVLLISCAPNLLMDGAWAGGDHRYFVGLQRLRHDRARVDPWHLALNNRLAAPDAVLLVGDAQPFDLEMPAYYNTVFDDSLFEALVRDRTPDEIRRELAALRIRYIYVHWGEIARYRSPGNYGFTDFVQPEVFQRLVDEGILDPPLPPIDGHPGQVFPVRE